MERRFRETAPDLGCTETSDLDRCVAFLNLHGRGHHRLLIWSGDINCAQTDKGSFLPVYHHSDELKDYAQTDLRKPKENWNKTPGYSKDEQDGLAAQLNPTGESGHKKLVEVWRLRNPDKWVSILRFLVRKVLSDVRFDGQSWTLHLLLVLIPCILFECLKWIHLLVTLQTATSLAAEKRVILCFPRLHCFMLRCSCTSTGIGWRLDTVIVSERILEKVEQCEIRQEV